MLTVPEVVDDEQFVARGDFVDAHHPDHGDVPPGRARVRRHGAAPAGPYEARDATVTDTDALLARRRAVADDELRQAARAQE